MVVVELRWFLTESSFNFLEICAVHLSVTSLILRPFSHKRAHNQYHGIEEK